MSGVHPYEQLLNMDKDKLLRMVREGATFQQIHDAFYSEDLVAKGEMTQEESDLFLGYLTARQVYERYTSAMKDRFEDIAW